MSMHFSIKSNINNLCGNQKNTAVIRHSRANYFQAYFREERSLRAANIENLLGAGTLDILTCLGGGLQFRMPYILNTRKE